MTDISINEANSTVNAAADAALNDLKTKVDAFVADITVIADTLGADAPTSSAKTIIGLVQSQMSMTLANLAMALNPAVLPPMPMPNVQ